MIEKTSMWIAQECCAKFQGHWAGFGHWGNVSFPAFGWRPTLKAKVFSKLDMLFCKFSNMFIEHFLIIYRWRWQRLFVFQFSTSFIVVLQTTLTQERVIFVFLPARGCMFGRHVGSHLILGGEDLCFWVLVKVGTNLGASWWSLALRFCSVFLKNIQGVTFRWHTEQAVFRPS